MKRDGLGLVTTPGSTEHLRLIALAYDLRGVDRNVLADYARDVFYAGRQAGERTRAEQLAPRAAGIESRRTHAVNLAVQLAASFTTLAGMWEGSTAVVGCLWYLVAGALWIWLSVRQRLHGLQPLNVIAIVVEAINLWSALQ